MKILFWDTETNGLPVRKGLTMREVSNWPRIIELAWQLVDLDPISFQHETVAEHVFLIRPDGWTIPKDKFWIDNGFTTEKSMAEGAPMVQVLDMFIFHLRLADLMVAHNIDFDYPVTGAEMIRHKMKVGHSIMQLCTMKSSTDLCKIPGKHGYKWPGLNELHLFLFGKEFSGAHAAGSDVEACKTCFIEMYRRNLIIIPHMKAV